MVENDLERYYSRRAPEYDAIYARPERQQDLGALERLIVRRLEGRDVLEVACGTGYWTRSIAASARTVLATDASPRMLDTASRRSYPKGRVEFRQMDAFAPASFEGRRFDGCFAGFWWSHVPRTRWRDFVRLLHDRLEPGSRCVFVDNRYVHGNSTTLVATDDAGDTYQDRVLADGSRYRVLKNFPGEGELRACMAGCADRIALTELEYFWCLSYDSRPPGPSVRAPGSRGEAAATRRTT